MSGEAVCVVGSGAREHALCRVLGRHADVVAAPGNAGMPSVTPEGHRITTTACRPVDVDADLFVIGPEVPLVAGLADELRAKGASVVGPGADGARLEGSKCFMKEVLVAAGVPTARYRAFDRADEALDFLQSLPGPWVVKTDGLAAGKGVLVATTIEEARADVDAKLGGSFGEAGRRVIVEEGLSGEECSLLVLCDGRSVVPLSPAQDYKRVGDGDTGPNTGGMGAYAPVPAVDGDLVDELVDVAVEPVVGELRRRGIDYRGVLYAGLMLTPEGPKVLEFNVRFGDPEAEVVLPLTDADAFELLRAVADGRLHRAAPAGTVPSGSGAAVCVVLAAEGYPQSARTGDPISGLDHDGQLAVAVPGVTVYHGATRRDAGSGAFVTDGGRVLTVGATAPDLGEARRRAYEAAAAIGWSGMHRRSDVAARALGLPAGAGASRARGEGTA